MAYSLLSKNSRSPTYGFVCEKRSVRTRNMPCEKTCTSFKPLFSFSLKWNAPHCMSSVSALSTKHAVYVAHFPLGCMWSRQFYVPAHRTWWVEPHATSSALWKSQSSSLRCNRSVYYLTSPLSRSDCSQEMVLARCDLVAKPLSDTSISTSLYLLLCI